MAEILLDDLSAAVHQYGDSTAHAALAVLEAWDRKADANSRGAVLFCRWIQEMKLGQPGHPHFATPWSPEAPASTPDGLADPAGAAAALSTAAAQVLKAHGSLSVAWGEVYRLQYAGRDLPGHGGPGDPLGIFRTVFVAPTPDGRFRTVGGDSFYLAVEFADPIRAQALLSYGNASQPESPHVGDQLDLFARKGLRPVWRTRAEIEAHLESRTRFGK